MPYLTGGELLSVLYQKKKKDHENFHYSPYEKTFLKIDCFMKENGRENLETR